MQKENKNRITYCRMRKEKEGEEKRKFSKEEGKVKEKNIAKGKAKRGKRRKETNS
jgi:hypothetical protein